MIKREYYRRVTVLHPVLAFSLCWMAWAQSGVRVQPPVPSNRKPETNSHLPAKPRVAREVITIKEKCRLRLLAGTDDLFNEGTAEFADGAPRILSELGPMLRKQEIHPIEVEGHTDGSGDAARSQRLSEQRAKAVESWLSSHEFLTPNTAVVRGFGKTKPMAPEHQADGSDDPHARQMNRRVEVVVDRCAK